MNDPGEIARKLVTVGRDRAGWHVSLANRTAKPEVTNWMLMSCASESDARFCARAIRRVVVDGIRASRARR